jgi:type I restriction enzyme, S subunit
MFDRRVYRLRDVTVCHDTRRVPVRSAERKQGAYPYYGASGVVDFVDSYLFDGDYLLVAEDGENLRTRKTPIAFMATGKFWVNNHAHVLESNDLGDIWYICYALSQTDIGGYLSGSTQPKLTQAALNSISVELPSKPYQERVAEFLRALDDKIAVNERTVQTTLALADAHMAVAGESVAAASRVTLAELAAAGDLEFGDGYRTKQSELAADGVPILRVADVADFEISPAGADCVDNSFRSKMSGKTSRPGDVVLTTKGTVGRVALMPQQSPEFVYSPQLCYFRTEAGSRVSPEFLFLWFRGPEFRRQAASKKGQTDMADYLNLRDVGSLRVSIPGNDAIRELDSIVNPLIARAELARRESQSLAQIRDGLLPKLISGELRIKSAELLVTGAI